MSYTSQLTGQQIDSALLTAQNIRTNAGIPVSLGNGLLHFYTLDDKLNDNSGGVPLSQAVLKTIRQQSSQFMKFKGNVSSTSALPAYGASGDVYFVTGNGHFYGWSGSEWVDLGDFNISASVSNPNLLDNWYFVNPVNQRNITDGSYNGYTIDRWVVIGWLAFKTGGMVFEKNYMDYPVVRQLIEYNDAMVGSPCVFSVKTENGVIVCPITYGTEKYEAYQDMVLYSAPHDGKYLFEIRPNVGVKLISAKVEYGSVSTLANDHAPDYATELLKCQRYYHVYETSTARPDKPLDCVPHMRIPNGGNLAQGTISVSGKTLWFNSADL